MAVLEPEERFLLSAWFLDQRTLLEISRVLRVHEATVSRRIGRLTARLHKELLASLQASGMSWGPIRAILTSIFGLFYKEMCKLPGPPRSLMGVYPLRRSEYERVSTIRTASRRGFAQRFH
jgi:hypothetical protein